MKLQTTQSILWIAILLSINFPLRAGIDPPPAVGARAISLGRAYVGISGDLWSIFHNPAAISGMPHFSVGAYAERRFLLKELTYSSVAAVMPFEQNQAVGFTASSFGFDLYRESQMGLTYAIQLMDIISIGTQINYANIHIRDYGASSVLMVQLGIHTKINKQLSLGLGAYNVNQANLQTQGVEESIPTLLSAGLAYAPSKKVLILAELQKDVDHPVSYRGGLEYEITPSMQARMGVSTEPLTLNMGVGFSWKQFKLDLAASYTAQLGYSPHLSFTYQAGRKGND